MTSKALVFDIGTTRIKAGLVDLESLKITDIKQAESQVIYPAPGMAEQDPEWLWRTVTRLAQDLVSSSDGSVDTVVFVAYMAGLVLLDEKGEPLTNLITWLDERAAGLPESVWSGLLRVSGYNVFRLLEFLRITGGAPSSTGKDVISKLVWIRENLPEEYERTKHVLGAIGYLVYKTTGTPVYPADDAHLTWLTDTRRIPPEWSMKLFMRYGLDPGKMPTIMQAHEIAGTLTKQASRELGLSENTRVLVGMGDVAAVALGSGAVEEHRLHVYLGTSGWTAFHTRKRILDISHYIGSLVSAHPGYYLAIGEQEVAGGAVDWASTLLGFQNVGEALSAIAEVPPGANGLLFGPWLFGERCPVDDPYARGVLIGFDLNTDRREIMRSVVEGVLLNTAWGFKYVSKLSGSREPVRLVGGLARSELVGQLLADMTGYIVEVPSVPELAGLRGGAMIAGFGLGYSTLEQYASKIKIARQHKPGKYRETYQELLASYTRMYKNVKKTFRELSHFRQQH